MCACQAAQSAAASGPLGAKAVFTYQATRGMVLAPSVCLVPGAMDEAIVSAYVNGLFTWCGDWPEALRGIFTYAVCASGVLRFRLP